MNLFLISDQTHSLQSRRLEDQFTLTDEFQIDLPSGTKIISITPSGASAWVQTVRIEALHEDGTVKSYFKKVRSVEAKRSLVSHHVCLSLNAERWVAI